MEAKERYELETISHSGLSALNVSPRAYRAYKSKEERISSRSLDLGSAIHCHILEPEEFDNRYMVSKFSIPTGMNAKFVEELFRTRAKDIPYNVDQTEEWVSNAHKFSGLKGTPAKAWDNFQKKEDLKAYWDYLEDSEGYHKLSPDEVEIMRACKASTELHKKANELLYGNPLSKSYNELELTWKSKTFPNFNMKSILDRIIVDEETKIITIVDLKTTGKNVHKFLTSYEKYEYYRQLALYRQAAIWYVKNILKMSTEGWEFEEYIVAVQTTGRNECAVYRPSHEDLKQGTDENLALLMRMEWHFENDLWDYPKEYYESDGVITLSLNGESV